MREVDHQRTFAGSMARRLEHNQAAIAKEIGVAAKLAPIEAARRQQVVQDEGALCHAVIMVWQFAFHDVELRVRKKTHPARMVEVKMRDDDILSILQLSRAPLFANRRSGRVRISLS